MIAKRLKSHTYSQLWIFNSCSFVFQTVLPSLFLGAFTALNWLSSLALLFREPGRVVPRAEILEQLWGYPPRRAADLRVVDVYVARLRGKLEPDPRNPELILTVRGTGYASQRLGDTPLAAAV